MSWMCCSSKLLWCAFILSITYVWVDWTMLLLKSSDVAENKYSQYFGGRVLMLWVCILSVICGLFVTCDIFWRTTLLYESMTTRQFNVFNYSIFRFLCVLDRICFNFPVSHPLLEFLLFSIYKYSCIHISCQYLVFVFVILSLFVISLLSCIV